MKTKIMIRVVNKAVAFPSFKKLVWIFMKAAELKSNLSKTKKAIDLSCKLVARDPSTVRLIGVTKNQSADTIRQAYNAGITDIGENYLQEALTKMDAL